MNATKVVLAYIAAHPYQTAFQVVNGVIICTPAAATVPVLAALGFGAGGLSLVNPPLPPLSSCQACILQHASCYC